MKNKLEWYPTDKKNVNEWKEELELQTKKSTPYSNISNSGAKKWNISWFFFIRSNPYTEFRFRSLIIKTLIKINKSVITNQSSAKNNDCILNPHEQLRQFQL